MFNSWKGTLSNIAATGPSRSNSSSEQTLLPDGFRYSLPSNYFANLGSRLEMFATGMLSNIVTTPGTLTLRFKLGSVNVWDSGAISLNTTAKTTLPWTLRVSMRASTMGSSTAGKVYAIGEFQSECVVGSPAPTSGGSGRLLVPVGAVAES